MELTTSKISLSYAALYELGERVASALQTEELEIITELILDRQDLIDRLLTAENPVETGTDWREWAEALCEQDLRLHDALLQYEEQLREEISVENTPY